MKIKMKLVGFLLLVLSFGLVVGFIGEANEDGEVKILPPGLDEFDIRILNNGNYIEGNIKPIEREDGIILAPLRLIFESAGYRVDWNEGGFVEMTKGKQKYSLNSNKSSHALENKNGNLMVDSSYFENIEGLELTYDVMTRSIILKTDFKEGDVYYYDMGKKTFKSSSNKDVSYRLNGGITLPEGDKKPLVFVMHGSHGATEADLNRFDLGYSYLLKELSKEGYLVVSPNVTIQYSDEFGQAIGNERFVNIFEATISSLVEANKGSDIFGIDLKDKIDFENVILIGHSRSGHGIFDLNNLYKDDDRIKIKGLLALAPARSELIKYDQVENPLGIILPELDGDVAFLDGQAIFDEMISDPNRKSNIQLVYLYGANHNAFNEALLIQDNGDIWNPDQAKIMEGANQRDFLVKYSKAYIKSLVDGDFVPNSLKLKDDKLLGYKALVSNYSPGEYIYKAQDGLRDIKNKGLNLSREIKSIDPDLNTVGIFNHPGNPEKLDLLNVKWQDNRGEMSFKVDGISKDKDELSLYLGQDSTDILNSKQDQSFRIILRDKDGNSASVLLEKGSQSLKYIDGSVEFDGRIYSKHTPMSMIDIDLADFDSIDRDNIVELTLKFDQTRTGSIFIRSIAFK